MQKNQNNTSFSPSPTHTWIVPSLARTEHAFTPENPFLFLIFFFYKITPAHLPEKELQDWSQKSGLLFRDGPLLEN